MHQPRLIAFVESLMLRSDLLGKSKVIQTFMKFVGQFDPSFASIGITSTTGQTAIVLDGQTVHSFLGGKIGFDFDSGKRAKAEDETRLAPLRVLIIDEISMAAKSLIHDIYYRLRQVKGAYLFIITATPPPFCCLQIRR